MKTTTWRSSLIALLLPVTSCDVSAIVHALTDADVPAVIAGVRGDTIQITMPDTVTHGVSFGIQFVTTGDGCLQGAKSTDVSAGGPDTVIVRPIDTITNSSSCTSVLKRVPHSATVVMNAPGHGTVRVIGAMGAWGGPQAIVDRSVEVR